MTEQQSLLAAIISNPDEDLPRSMYADYLQDSDKELDRLLGQYIKRSLELSTHRKLIKPRVDVALSHVQVANDGYYGIDSYQWYRRGIELDKEVKELWSKVKIYSEYWFWEFNYELDRGFISSISCTASQFFSIKDSLIWHESMVDTISLPDPASGRTTGEWYKKEPRPCPLTAHPVREIEITDYHIGNSHTAEIIVWQNKLAPKYGIEFTVLDE